MRSRLSLNLIRKTLSLLFLCFSIKGNAQPELNIIPYRKGKLWGYCDSTKRIIITPRFDSVEVFETFKQKDKLSQKKVALVWKNKKVGLIDDKGKELVPCSFQQAYVMNDEPGRRRVALYRQNGPYEKHSYGYYLDERKLVRIKKWNENDEYMGPPARLISARIAPSYLDTNIAVKKISTDKFLIIRKQWRYQNDQQLYKIDSSILQARDVKKIKHMDSIFFVKKENGWGIVSLSQNEILPAIYDSIRQVLWIGIYAYKKNGLWRAIDIEWNKTSLFWYQDIRNNSGEEGLLIKKNNRWGVLLGDYQTEIWVGPTRYHRYEVVPWRRLVLIFDKKGRLVGYAGFNGISYWD